MAKISKYVKLDKDVLMEYVYNDGNMISDRYKVMTDLRTRSKSYIAGDTSLTKNLQDNQLFNVDLVGTRYAKVDASNYSYLSISDYSSGTPLRHDTIKFHLPINWTFGEYLGFYVRVYSMDSTNTLMFNLSNFYFDMTDTVQQNLMDYTVPPILFQEKLWGKTISIDVPAVSSVSGQLSNNTPKANSLNSNLTTGLGFSMTSPIFVDFLFITSIQTINNVKTYVLGQKITTTVPQAPEFESLSLMVKHSSNGDFFEIYGTYNDTIADFKKFIDDSVRIGHKYYVQYIVTMYEQNVRGKTLTFTITEGFNDPIEFRPIIKFSTTTAIIDVEMKLIDSVDDSFISRRASYGMLQDEVSRYSLNMSKINLANASKPKVYNIKNNIDASLLGKTDALGRPLNRTRGRTGKGVRNGLGFSKDTSGLGVGDGSSGSGLGSGLGTGQVQIEQVKVPFPFMIEKFNVIGKSENELVNKNLFYGIGKMQVQIYPFDNNLSFVIARGDTTAPNYLDLSGFGDIKFVIKNDASIVEFPMLTDLGLDLKLGQVAFKVTQSKFQQIKRIFLSGINLFYIAAGTQMIYTGLFQIYDTTSNVANLNQKAPKSNANASNILKDNNLKKETAVVTRQAVSGGTDPQKKGG